MISLIFDTETTGLPIWNSPSDHPDQPHIVELAAELWDNGALIDSIDTLVIPPIDITPELVSIHGITTEMARDLGIPKADAIERFLGLVGRADQLVGHVVSFDVRMMRIETARATGTKWENPLDKFCTAARAKSHLKLKKNPTLTEAHEALVGETFEQAHRAGPDVAATRRVFQALIAA